MAENQLYETSMQVLEYAKNNAVSIEKALAHFSLAHDFLRRNRVKIFTAQEDGIISDTEYKAYNELYDEVRTSSKRPTVASLGIDTSKLQSGTGVNYSHVVDPNRVAPQVVLTTWPPQLQTSYGCVIDTSFPPVTEEEPETKGSRTWENRNSKGNISSYGYKIQAKGQRPLEGELSRGQMERIYSLYPYNTLETVSSEFSFLTAEDLGRIARAFGIKKTRKVPKHIIEESTEDKIAEFEVNAKLKNVSKKMEVYKSVILEKQNKLLVEDNEYYRRAQEWAENVLDKYLSRPTVDITLRGFKFEAIEDAPLGVNTYTMFSDIHFGKFFPTKKMRYGRGTDKHILRERCHRIARETVKAANANGSQEVHMICAGDLFESIIPGGMHQGQVMDMDGDEQVMFALDVFEEMLAIVHLGVHRSVAIKLHGIGGNHDRIQAKREEDRKRTGTLLFYAMLEKLVLLRSKFVQQNIEILHRYEDGIISFAVDGEGLSFIGHHGDSPMAKKQAEKQINMHKTGQARNFTILFQGHMHSHKCLDEGPNFVYLQLGAVTSGDSYVQNQICEGSQPSFIIGTKAQDDAFGFDFYKFTLA